MLTEQPQSGGPLSGPHSTLDGITDNSGSTTGNSSIGVPATNNSSTDNNNPIDTSANNGSDGFVKKTTCQNCRTTNTPLWRRDDNGQVLCNACGLFLKLHGRPRPTHLKTDVIKPRNRVRPSMLTASHSTTGNLPGVGLLGTTLAAERAKRKMSANMRGPNMPGIASATSSMISSMSLGSISSINASSHNIGVNSTCNNPSTGGVSGSPGAPITTGSAAGPGAAIASSSTTAATSAAASSSTSNASTASSTPNATPNTNRLPSPDRPSPAGHMIPIDYQRQYLPWPPPLSHHHHHHASAPAAQSAHAQLSSSYGVPPVHVTASGEQAGSHTNDGNSHSPNPTSHHQSNNSPLALKSDPPTSIDQLSAAAYAAYMSGPSPPGPPLSSNSSSQPGSREDLSTSSPSDSYQQLKTRVTELELVNDLYRSRMTELENSEAKSKSLIEELKMRINQLEQENQQLKKKSVISVATVAVASTGTASKRQCQDEEPYKATKQLKVENMV